MQNIQEIEKPTIFHAISAPQWKPLRNHQQVIGERQVQQLNVHDYYDLGKKIDSIEKEIGKAADKDVFASSFAWPLFLLRWQLTAMLAAPCALLPASQRAAKAVINTITELIPESVEEIFALDNSTLIHNYQLTSLSTSFANFETVLKNDMPEMSTFAVAQIGIYRTEDLISKSILQIEESVRDALLPLAESDILEAGKCLAFRVPTAAGFHMSRAIKTGMNQYYESLTGKPYDLKPSANNWGTKTQVLKESGADEKITEFLVHIRKAYRNPITHPDATLESAEAFNFFAQALSVISMMLASVKKIRDDAQLNLALMRGADESGWLSAPSGLLSSTIENAEYLKDGDLAEDQDR